MCVCVCFVLTERKIGWRGRLETPNLSSRRTRPGLRRGLPEPKPFVYSQAAGSSSVATRLTKCPLCFKTKGQANLEPSSPQLRLGPSGSAPLFRVEHRASRNPGVAGRIDTFFPYPFPREKQTKKQHPFLGEDTRATSTLRPEPPFPVGTEVPALCQALGAGSLGVRRPLPLAGKIWPDLLSASVQVPGPAQGAPGLDAAKTRRSPARESHARHPRAASGPTTIRRPEVRPAQSRAAPVFQEHQGLGARAPQGAGSRAHGGQSQG